MKRKTLKVLVLVAICLSIAIASTFREQRIKFRQEINLKVETPLDKKGLYTSVTFKNEKPWDFKVSEEEAQKIKSYLKDYFNVSDSSLLNKMIEDMNKGRFIVYKEYSPNADGVNLKCAFLSPKVPYWEYLTDINGIENLFYVYNFSVELGKKTPIDTYVILQTQGKFMGFTKAVTLPLIFHQDDATRTLSFKMPTQQELIEVVNRLPVLKPGRESLEERFIDLCRTHPWFQDKDEKGNYLVSDEEILKMLDKVILHKDTKCDVYECVGRWRVWENISDRYMLCTYSLRTVVNIRAFIPPNIPLLGAMFKKIAQSISDEVSAKYLPLSMKNFRDHTVAWAKKNKEAE